MKNSHPIVTAARSTSSVNGAESSSSSEPAEPIIRLKLDKPLHWEWELTTSADALPVIQLLDKDGRLLVETTGRTAQRARGSFRTGLRSHEEFPSADSPISKNSRASSSFSSPSTTSGSSQPALPPGNRIVDGFSTKFGTVQFPYKPRKSRSEISIKDRADKIDKTDVRKKRYSTGVETNVNNENAPKRYSAGDYLRQQILDDLRSKSTLGKTPEEVAKDRYKKVKAYLRSQSDGLPYVKDEKFFEVGETSAPRSDPSKSDENQRCRKTSAPGDNPRLRSKRSKSCLRTRSDLIAREDESSKGQTGVDGKVGSEELARIRSFLREKIAQKMIRDKVFCSLPETAASEGILGREHADDRDDKKSYRTRKVRSETNIIKFDPAVLERERTRKRSESARRVYHRSKSDVAVQSSDQKPQLKRASSNVEKRKLYRKTKSDVLLGRVDGNVKEEDKDTEDAVKRIRSQENIERSWREYKERKKQEKLLRDPEKDVAEEDFMSKPRWKDLQNDLCSERNCRVCQNDRNCVKPSKNRVEKSSEANEEPEERPGTSLQENYILLDNNAESLETPVKDDGGIDASSSLDSPDFGYSSIPKNAFKNYRELYARSNVKKSDTFKIVDGSEEPEDSNCERNGSDESSFRGWNGEAPLANKSNEEIARDYFKRVYELLKRRQEEARKLAEGVALPGYDDSSSSNYIEEAHRKKFRRKRRDKSRSGEEVVAVPPAGEVEDSWKAPPLRLPLSNESPSDRRRSCRPQQFFQPASDGKRPRPGLISCKVNVKDIGKYFDGPNKENTSGNAVNREEKREEERDRTRREQNGATMGSNLSRHNGKGLTGRRTQSSGNLCDPKGKFNGMGKILVPCSSAQKERYKFCGSLPNHLDDKDALDDEPRESNNVMTDTIAGNLGGTLPHKKRSLGVHFSDGGPTGTLDLVKHRSQDSLDENDPWRYQQSDLDLVRCRHGNFDSVRRNRSTDAVSGESGRKYGGHGTSTDDRCHRNSDLDLVGTLPKRRHDLRCLGKSLESNTSSSEPCVLKDAALDDDLLMRMVHKPDCELVKHRQQMNKCVELKLGKLVAGSEPQDQGYASERSPEDEHPPSLPGQPFPSVNPENTFVVTLQKSSRGLGLSVSGGGTAGPVRVKRLFPQQPAALSNKLQPGDILLAANGIPLTGLTNYEALEVLRTTPNTVELVVCRLPGDTSVTPPGAPPPPPARREPPAPLRLLNPLPPLQIEPCGEFDIEMTKVGGSLGFTLRKADSSALGHYVRALVREPALSDGRIRPGDKIVAVDGAPLSPMSHEEAVALLRQCGPKVRLRLYRDLAQTPVSALSPTEPDHPLRPPRTSLRQEAVDMLCDLAVRKLSPGTSSGSSCKQSSGTSCNSPRRLRRLATRTPTAGKDQETLEKLPEAQSGSAGSQTETSDSDQCSIRTQITNSQPNTPGTDIIDPPSLYDVCDASSSSKSPAARPSFLDLSAPQDKPHFQFCSFESDGEFPSDSAANSRGKVHQDDYEERDAPCVLTADEQDNDLPSEPASMPPVLSSTSSTSTTAFSYKNPAYQSANPACGTGIDVGAKNKMTHSSDQDIPGKIIGADDPGGSKGLLKWKGVMFAPNDEESGTQSENEEDKGGKDTTDSAAPFDDLEQGSEVFMVELTRGWNSRLGFSLQPEGNRTVVSVVHPDSVAAKDGRLKQGDILMMVNDESVENMSTSEIIDLLRKIRGSIGITVMRRNR